ncbi:hypothetical protein ABK040_009181 [Willaertia magna]
MLQHLPAEIFSSIVFYLIGDPFKTYSLSQFALEDSINFNNIEKDNSNYHLSDDRYSFEMIDQGDDDNFLIELTNEDIIFINGLSFNSIDDLINVLSLENTHPLIKEKIYNNSYIWSNIVHKFPNLIYSKKYFNLLNQFVCSENNKFQIEKEKLRINLSLQLLNSLFDSKNLTKRLFINELFQIKHVNNNVDLLLNNFPNINELTIDTNDITKENVINFNFNNEDKKFNNLTCLDAVMISDPTSLFKSHLNTLKKIILNITYDSSLTNYLLLNRKEIINFIELNKIDFEIHLFDSYKSVSPSYIDQLEKSLQNLSLQNNNDDDEEEQSIKFDIENFGKYCKTVTIDDDTSFSNLNYFINLEDLTIDYDDEKDIVFDFTLPFLQNLEIYGGSKIKFNNFIANNLQKLNISCGENIKITKLQKPFPLLDYLEISCLGGYEEEEDDDDENTFTLDTKFWLEGHAKLKYLHLEYLEKGTVISHPKIEQLVLINCCGFKVENVPSLKELLLSSCNKITINNLRYLDRCTIINSSLDMNIDEINIFKIECLDYFNETDEKINIKINKNVNEYYFIMDEVLEQSNDLNLDFNLNNLNNFELIVQDRYQNFTVDSFKNILQKLKIQSSKKGKISFRDSDGSSLHTLLSNFNLESEETFEVLKTFINCLNDFQDIISNNKPSKAIDFIGNSSSFLKELKINFKENTTGKKLIFLNNLDNNLDNFKFLKSIFLDKIIDLIEINLNKLPLLEHFYIQNCKTVTLQSFEEHVNLTTLCVTNIEYLTLSLQLKAKKLRELIIKNITNLFILNNNNNENKNEDNDNHNWFQNAPVELIDTPKLLFKYIDLPQPKEQVQSMLEYVKGISNSFIGKLWSGKKKKKNTQIKLKMEIEL